jgi:hypothetical protein
VVEAAAYLCELTRYIHLNPLRAGVVRDLAVLDTDPWTGHTGLRGRQQRPWQAVDEVLGHLAKTRGLARPRDRALLATGVGQGRRRNLQGGGRRRSAGGWAGVAALRRGREADLGEERILVQLAFVVQVRRECGGGARGAEPTPDDPGGRGPAGGCRGRCGARSRGRGRAPAGSVPGPGGDRVPLD